MFRKLMPMAVASALFVTLFCINPLAWSFERHTPNPIPQDQIFPPSAANPERSAAFCEITNDTDYPGYFYDSLIQGSGMAVYMNPEYCGASPYPFKITDVHFYTYAEDETYRWPLLVRVNIREVSQGDSCSGPGQVICYQDFSVPADSGYPLMMNLSLSSPCCVDGPFFLEIIYTEAFDPAHRNPSLLMDAETAPADTCVNWMNWDGEYWEWSDFWAPPPPGNAIIRATGYTQDPDCENHLWYWKADKPDQTPFPAPSGMPDFDQNQDEWIAYCGPVAVANCLWWYNAVPEEWTAPQLIDTLARYFKTNPTWGTFVDSMEMGLEQYFSDYGFALQESTFHKPDFFEMEDSLKRCQDIILLLGWWYYNESLEQWYREGGHFVTMAGVCSESLKIAVSDPDADKAESGWPGRVRPPDHPPHPGDPTVHNDPTYVCHDIYQSTVDIPFPSPGNEHWEIDYVWAKGRYSGLNVPQEFISVTRPAPRDGKDLYVTEVEYAVMICPTPSAVEDEEGSSTPKDFELDQNYPNPFNNQTVIKFNLRRAAEVSLTIYNILGQKVRTLAEGRMNAGSQTIGWDGKDDKGNDLSSGIYFYQLKAGQLTETKRLVLLK